MTTKQGASLAQGAEKSSVRCCRMMGDGAYGSIRDDGGDTDDEAANVPANKIPAASN